VYLSLLRVYLSPELTSLITRENGTIMAPSSKELHSAAFDLLNRHFMQIDIPKVLTRSQVNYMSTTSLGLTKARE
jgi:hypothetical protein